MIVPILLLLTWILLRLEGASLSAIGVDKPVVRMRQFAGCFLVSGTAAALQQIGFATAAGASWQINSTVTAAQLLEQLRFTTNSVLYEEFVFRGYLLYQAIRFLGLGKGVLLDAIAFGIYHWFSFGVLGNVPAMGYVFLLTGGFGAMCALGFAATRSIAAPVGLHFGWNIVTYTVFSAGPLGRGILLPSNGATRLQPQGGAGLFLGFVFPMIYVSVVSFYFVRFSKLQRDGAHAQRR
jgi:uncharacterized protein